MCISSTTLRIIDYKYDNGKCSLGIDLYELVFYFISPLPHTICIAPTSCLPYSNSIIMKHVFLTI